MPRSKQYKIEFDSNKVSRDWDGLKKALPDKMNGLIEFLEVSPTDRLQAVGKLKKLKGKYQGVLQYDISKDEYRAWYVVDKPGKVVTILYAGTHPG